MAEAENKSYPILYSDDYKVVTANDLIKGRQKMSLREAQLLYITIAQIVKEDHDFKTYTTSVTALAEFMGIAPDSLYRDLESICTSLLQRVVKIKMTNENNPRDAKWKAFQWISYAEYSNGKLTIRLNDEMKPFLIDLASHYSQILLGALCSFTSYYSARLYQYIVCEIGEHTKYTKEEWTFTCEELRDFFQVEKNEYSRPHDLIKKTIKAALKELDASDFAHVWDYEELHAPGRGRPLSGVRFKAMIFKNREEKDYYLKVQKQIIDAVYADHNDDAQFKLNT